MPARLECHGFLLHNLTEHFVALKPLESNRMGPRRELVQERCNRVLFTRRRQSCVYVVQSRFDKLRIEVECHATALGVSIRPLDILREPEVDKPH